MAQLNVALIGYAFMGRAHSNAYTLWQQLRSPVAPSRAQYVQLEAASQLATLTGAPATLELKDEGATLNFPLPRQAVSLIVLGW